MLTMIIAPFPERDERPHDAPRDTGGAATARARAKARRDESQPSGEGETNEKKGAADP